MMQAIRNREREKLGILIKIISCPPDKWDQDILDLLDDKDIELCIDKLIEFEFELLCLEKKE